MTTQSKSGQPKTRLFAAGLLASGFLVLGLSLRSALALPNLYWVILVVLTALGSLFPVRLPFLKRKNQALVVTINDVFIYTAILFFSPEAAVLVAATEGLLGPAKSLPLSKVAFNVSQNSLSCFIVGHLFYWIMATNPPLDPASIGPANTVQLFAVLGGCSLLYFVLNSGAVALAIALTTGVNPTKLWRENFVWAGVTTVAAASTAALIFLNFQDMPIPIIGIAIPIVLVIYSAFQMHLSKIRQAGQHLDELDELYHSTIASLAMAIDAKDQSTHGHVQRVQALVLGLARKVGIDDPAELKGLRAAALLHDIGKLAVPEYILNKPGPLNEAEMNQMRAHPVVGADILETVPFPYPVTPYVRYHHERWDGKGYPTGLKEKEIPKGARILSIVDCYDALRSDRPYRPKLPRDVALNFIQQEAGKAYDPAIVEAMVQHIDDLEQQIAEAEREVPKSVLARLENTFQRTDDAGSSSPIRSTVFHDIASTHKAVQAVYEISRNIGRSLNVTETLELLTSRIRELVPYSACSIYLVNSKDERVVPYYVAGMHKELLEQVTCLRGEGITGWVAANNKALLNLSPAPEFMQLQELQDTFKSCLSVPLSIERDVVGVITLYSNEEDAYTTEHMQLMETIAPHAASAINNAIIHEETREDAYTDLLTGLPNLRYYFTFIGEELARATRLKYSVTLLMMDLELFKNVNDEYGHKTGDAVLMEFGRLLRNQLRRSDLCLRYGGDEFVGILPGIDRALAYETIIRLQKAVEETPIKLANQSIQIGVSIGAATFPDDTRDHNQLLALADQAMYRNKVQRARGRGESATQILPFQKRAKREGS